MLPPMSAPPPSDVARLELAPILDSARRLAASLREDLPGQPELARAADLVARAALDADAVTRRMRKPWSLHKLPALFLAVALVALAGWTWNTFFRVSTLTLALPDRDAVELKDRLRGERLSIAPVDVPGSREAAALVQRGEVDLAFVQGGVPLPPGLRRAEVPGHELLLVFLRPGLARLAEAKVVLTSREGEGSHSVLLDVFRLLGAPVPRLVHAWGPLTAVAPAPVPAEVDAVVVVKNPSDEQTMRGVAQLVSAGFTLADLPLGARGTRLDYLSREVVEPGWLLAAPLVPAAPTPAWGVATYLVAREGLTPRLLAHASRLLSPRGSSLTEGAVLPTSEGTSEALQGIDAFLGIVVNIGLAFLALLGLDVMAYRKQFHELNALVSLLSFLQSDKDVMGVADAARREANVRALGLVSDLLGLISQLNSFYTQENSSLLFNNLSEVIHERTSALKINIQLKLVQAAMLRGEVAAARP